MPEVGAVGDLAQVTRHREGQHASGRAGGGGVQAGDRGQRRGGREQPACRGGDLDERGGNGDRPGHPDHRERPADSGRDRHQPREHREQHPGGELVDPRLGGVVGVRRVGARVPQLQGHRAGHDRREQEHHQHCVSAQPQQEQQHQRQHDVELLLDRERPEVQERAGVGRAGREVVAAVGDELPVRQVDERGLPVTHHPVALRRARHEELHGGGGDDDQDRRRQQSPDPPRVEPPEPERAVLVDLRPDDVRDQEARQHEEQVDADVAALQRTDPAVEQHDEVDRHRPESVQLGTVGPAVTAGRLATPYRRPGPV